MTGSGFRSNWHRLMQKAIKPHEDGSPPLLSESFTFHDLRAKRASDAEDIMEAKTSKSRGKNIRQQRGY